MSRILSLRLIHAMHALTSMCHLMNNDMYDALRRVPNYFLSFLPNNRVTSQVRPTIGNYIHKYLPSLTASETCLGEGGQK